MSSDGWTTIESEPGVFHQLISEFGVKGVQVEELWSLDTELLEALRPVYGLVFLFKWTGEKDTRPIADNTLGKVFFAKQVIQNACATQAILAVLLNSQGIELGQQLTELRDFTADFPPEMKGLAIGNSDSIRTAHNSFARPEPLVPEEKDEEKGDEAFHFISYVPVDGTLYELDGLKEGPIPLCSCNEGDWLKQVVPHIQERMARYTMAEVCFNIMAITRDRLLVLQEKAQQLESQRQTAMQQLEGSATSTTGAAASAIEVDEASAGASAAAHAATGAGGAALGATVMSLDAELAAVRQDMQEEQDKRHRWCQENIRRRHNYVPLLFNMLRLFAERGQLTPLVEHARTLAKEKKAQPGGQ